MTLQNIIDGAKRLPVAQQIELWGVLGDMIGPPPDVPLTPAQAKDLDMRIDEIRSGRATLLPGDEVFERLRKRE